MIAWADNYDDSTTYTGDDDIVLMGPTATSSPIRVPRGAVVMSCRIVSTSASTVYYCEDCRPMRSAVPADPESLAMIKNRERARRILGDFRPWRIPPAPAFKRFRRVFRMMRPNQIGRRTVVVY
jgi:hypothetical protein